MIRASSRARWAAIVCLDVLAPILVALGVSRLWHHRAWGALGSGTTLEWHLTPTDENGVLWFYWWLGDAARRGRTDLVSDKTCWPRGEMLGAEFPNRVDAWLAQPLLQGWGMPTGYDLFVLLLPVLNAVCAYWFLRALTTRRVQAFCAALVFAFGSYTVLEVSQGRAVSGLLGLVPLAVAPWVMSCSAEGRRRWIWASLAGVLLSLQAWAYVTYALFVALLFTGCSVWLAVFPGDGAKRLDALIRLMIAGGVSLLLTLPYLHELLVLRTLEFMADGVHLATLDTRWDVGIIADLFRRFTSESAAFLPLDSGAVKPPYFDTPYWIAVQGESMAWDYLWRPASDRSARRVAVSALFVLGAVGVGVRSRRARPVLVILFAIWLLSLGPHLAWSTEARGAQLVTVGGYRFALPLAGALTAAPWLDLYIRPYRLVPFVALAAAAVWLLAMQDLSAWSDRRLAMAKGATAWSARVVQQVARWGLVLVALAALAEQARYPWSTYRLQPWDVHPFLEELANTPDDTVIAELPAGEGHRVSGLQAIHQRTRIDSQHDFDARALAGPPPSWCYKDPFSEAMWYLGRDGPEAQAIVSRGFADETVASVVGQGFRYVLLYPALYAQRKELDITSVRSTLNAVFGPPILQDRTLEVWAALPESRP